MVSHDTAAITMANRKMLSDPSLRPSTAAISSSGIVSITSTIRIRMLSVSPR